MSPAMKGYEPQHREVADSEKRGLEPSPPKSKSDVPSTSPSPRVHSFPTSNGASTVSEALTHKGAHL